MAREVLENFEDHLNSIQKEWGAMKEKWFHGETMDPVFEGVVRDFCSFDDTMQAVHQRVGVFMKSVESLATGMTAMADGVSACLTQAIDSQIASDSCKLKEATQQIARSDAPHSAIAKLRRDMQFNIISPVQNHIANNRNLKMSLDIRRQRLVELNSAKKQLDSVISRNLAHTDRRYLQAQSNFETAKMTFNDVDRHVFEWLYILEEYRGDILDSTLQTLKYLEYEFFAASAHALSASLPSRMEFRPMVEMTPEHLEAQVDMELAESEQAEEAEGVGIAPISDFSARLIDKKTRAEPSDKDVPALPVDPLSLSSLLAQGFEEGPARRALRLHQNNTQDALEWLLNGQHDEEEKRKTLSEGVRMPTTVKRVQKLRAMRKAQAEKNKDKLDKRDEGVTTSKASADTNGSSVDDRGGSASSATARSGDDDGKGTAEFNALKTLTPARPAPQADLLSLDAVEDKPRAKSDLLSLDDDTPVVPTDFTKPVDRTALPQQIVFDTTMCEKPPLPAAVAAGIVQPRVSSGANAAVVDTDVLQSVQSIAAQAQVSPEDLLRAAQQLQQRQQLAVMSAGAPPLGTNTATSAGYPDFSSSVLSGLTSDAMPLGGLPASQPLSAVAARPVADQNFQALLSGPAAAASAEATGTPDLMAFANAGFDSAK